MPIKVQLHSSCPDATIKEAILTCTRLYSAALSQYNLLIPMLVDGEKEYIEQQEMFNFYENLYTKITLLQENQFLVFNSDEDFRKFVEKYKTVDPSIESLFSFLIKEPQLRKNTTFYKYCLISQASKVNQNEIEMSNNNGAKIPKSKSSIQ